MASSLMILPSDFLKELMWIDRVLIIISATADLLNSRARKASSFVVNSLRPQL